MNFFWDLFLGGITRGSIYALIALGYTMVYGILELINFAHGEIYMIGAFTALIAASILTMQGLTGISVLLLAMLIAVLYSSAYGYSVEKIAYKPLRRAPRLSPLISAIGASYFLQYAFLGLFGSNVKGYPDFDLLKGNWNIFGVDVLKTQVVVIVAAVIFLIILYLFVQRTKTGKAMQAVSEDKDAAALMGIDVGRIIVITFVVGGALAGAAGFFYALLFKQVKFDMGFFPGIKAFTAAVLGGIGNVVGAMLGGMFLGIAESLFPNLVLDGACSWGTTGCIPAPYQLKDALAFIMLVLVLIFRPTGILGERLATKKA